MGLRKHFCSYNRSDYISLNVPSFFRMKETRNILIMYYVLCIMNAPKIKA